MLKQQITQEELYKQLAQSASVPESAIEKIFEELVRIATSETKQNSTFLLPGFGTIENRARRAHSGEPGDGRENQVGSQREA
jgi:nucleoid DNA-binding protein